MDFKQFCLLVVGIVVLFLWARHQLRKPRASEDEIYQDIVKANGAHINPTLENIVAIGEAKEQERDPAETETTCARFVREGKLFEVKSPEGHITYSTTDPNPPRWYKIW